jgi:hypothetical protein
VLADFLLGVLHASRLFSDELLAACLDLLLAAPPSLVPVQARPGPRRAALLRIGAAHVSARSRGGACGRCADIEDRCGGSCSRPCPLRGSSSTRARSCAGGA